MKEKLAVLGASYLQLPLIKKAKELGYEVHCFAWDDGRAVGKAYADFFYPVSVLEKEEILHVCQGIGIKGITTIATDLCVPTISYVAQEMHLISNSEKSALLSTNKSRMKAAFFAHQVKTPAYYTFDSYSPEVLERGKFPLIVKPTDRSGSRGIRKVETHNDLQHAILGAKEESLEGEVIVEEYIAGEEVSVESISWGGNHFILAITDKVTTGEPYFVEIEHHQPSRLSTELQERIKIHTKEALNALEITNGASHSEFRITSTGEIYAIEVGARMGGDFIGSHLTHFSTGIDTLKAVIDIAVGKPPSLKPKKPTYYTGVHFITPDRQWVVECINKYPDWIYCSEVEKVSKEKQVKSSNDRSGYFIYRGTKKIRYDEE